MKSLIYGVYKNGDDVILQFTEDKDCLSPEVLSGSLGHIYGKTPEEMLDNLKVIVRHIGQRVPLTHVELNVNEGYRILEVR